MHHIGLISVIGSGASADVLRIGKGLVLKLFHENADPGIVRREIDIAARAKAEGLLAPRPIGERTVDGRHGILFEELEGEPLLGDNAGWRIGRARTALRKLAACHADIHMGEAADLIHEQHVILQVRIDDADVDQRLKDAALERLAALPRGNRLCHGDFHPRNAIETAHGIAAIDWSNGCSGDPAGDVARTELLLRYGLYGGLLRRFRPARWFRHLAANFYLNHYCQLSGMPIERIAAWRLPVAVACLVKASRIHRLAVLDALQRYQARA